MWSLRGNVCDIPTDCPQRERAAWTGDWQMFAPTAAYLYDVAGFTRKWLRDVASTSGPTAASPTCRRAARGGLRRSARRAQRLGRMGRRRGQRAVGPVPGVRRQLAAAGDVAVDAALGRLRGGRRPRGRHPARAERQPEPRAHERYLWDTGFHWGEWLEREAEVDDFAAFLASDKAEVATAYLHRSARQLAAIAEAPRRRAGRARTYRESPRVAAAWQGSSSAPDGTLTVQTQASHVRALAFGLVPDDLAPSGRHPARGARREADGHLTTGFLSSRACSRRSPTPATSTRRTNCCCRTPSRPGSR